MTGTVPRWGLPSASVTGGAWLSSARVVRCWVKSRKRAQPCLLLVAIRLCLGTLAETAGVKTRKVGMTSNHHALMSRGYTMLYNGGTNHVRYREVELISKGLCSD